MLENTGGFIRNKIGHASKSWHERGHYDRDERNNSHRLIHSQQKRRRL